MSSRITFFPFFLFCLHVSSQEVPKVPHEHMGDTIQPGCLRQAAASSFLGIGMNHLELLHSASGKRLAQCPNIHPVAAPSTVQLLSHCCLLETVDFAVNCFSITDLETYLISILCPPP